MPKIYDLIDSKLLTINEENENASYKDPHSGNYDRQMAEDALYHTIGPLTGSPRWSSEWTSRSEPVPGFVPNGPAPNWSEEEIVIAFCGDPSLLDDPYSGGNPKSPYYGRSPAPMVRYANTMSRRWGRDKSKKAQFDMMADSYALGSAALTKMMKPGYDEGRSPFISWVSRTIKGAMEHGIGGSQESILASGGVSKGFGGEERKEATAGLRGLSSVLDSKDPEDVRKMADQVKGDYRFKKSHDRHPDNPFGGFSSRYYDVVTRYADALESGNEDQIDAAISQIHQLKNDIEESDTPIRGVSTGGEAISSLSRKKRVGVGSLDEPIPGSDDGSTMAGQVEGDDAEESYMDPETVNHLLDVILTQDLGKALKNMPKFMDMAAEVSKEYGLGYKVGESIGGPLTVNEFRYLIRVLGPIASNYPGKGNLRKGKDKKTGGSIPRDGIGTGWWKAGEDPEIEQIPGSESIWTSKWVRSGSPNMTQVEIAKEMNEEYLEFQKLGIPTVRKWKTKVDAKTGEDLSGVTSKVAVNTALQSARLKLVLVARLEGYGLNESLDVDSIIIAETARSMIRMIDESAKDTKINKYVKGQVKKLPTRIKRTVSPLINQMT